MQFLLYYLTLISSHDLAIIMISKLEAILEAIAAILPLTIYISVLV